MPTCGDSVYGELGGKCQAYLVYALAAIRCMSHYTGLKP